MNPHSISAGQIEQDGQGAKNRTLPQGQREMHVSEIPLIGGIRLTAMVRPAYTLKTNKASPRLCGLALFVHEKKR